MVYYPAVNNDVQLTRRVAGLIDPDMLVDIEPLMIAEISLITREGARNIYVPGLQGMRIRDLHSLSTATNLTLMKRCCCSRYRYM